jgi:hypothetical protein
MTPEFPTSSVLSIASVVSARFPSLSLDQCVFAARRAVANGERDPEGYALSIAGDSIAAIQVRAMLRAEYDIDCDASYGDRGGES